MTRNLFLGADLTPACLALAAGSVATLPAELARRGLRYRRVAAAVNGDVALPSAAGFNVGLSDLPIETPHGTFALARGWMSVDATVRGTPVRLISTHLEVAAVPAAATAQLAQAGERLDDPADALRARIDLILTRGKSAATEAFLVGHTPTDLRSGLWPSDHAGVVATLKPV